jgi:hypothetical protein
MEIKNVLDDDSASRASADSTIADSTSNEAGKRFSHWLYLAEWVALVLLTVQFAVRTLPDAWKTLNTDFPNYFVTASLVHAHADTSRIYEWVWIERQKDHLQLDQRIIGMVPITPFSTLAVYPLTSLPALTAKHWWNIFNLGLLAATVMLIRRMTGIAWRRILLVVMLNFALRLNFMDGQYYVLLLLLLTLACYLYLRQRRFLSGVAIGIAAGLKIFPVIFLLYFLRKRDWRAFAGGAVAGLAAALVSIATFGWELHRVYLVQVLPASLRGEGLDPYNLSAASLSSLLHRLFVYEPQLNPHPAINVAWLFAIFHPVLQMLVMAPALLLAERGSTDARRVRLEWAAIVTASLAISTSPGTYLFTLLILPVCLMLEVLPRGKHYVFKAVLVGAYAVATFMSGAGQGYEGWLALLAVPRLHALLVLCVLAYVLLVRQRSLTILSRDRMAWAAALGALMIFSVVGNLRHQRGLYDDYQYRVVAPEGSYMTVHPAAQGGGVAFVSMRGDGYHSGMDSKGAFTFSPGSADDELAVTASERERWVERVGRESSVISGDAARPVIQRAESPVMSSDGRWLAYLRVEQGRGRVWVRALHEAAAPDAPATPAEMNVMEMSFAPGGGMVFAASSGGRPGLFMAGRDGQIRALGLTDARYPAVSPDGQWLTYSQLERGSWHLWLRDLKTGSQQRVSHAECNNMEPAWAGDSKTLYYASDCGRAQWFSVICRRRVVP